MNIQNSTSGGQTSTQRTIRSPIKSLLDNKKPISLEKVYDRNWSR